MSKRRGERVQGGVLAQVRHQSISHEGGCKREIDIGSLCGNSNSLKGAFKLITCEALSV